MIDAVNRSCLNGYIKYCHISVMAVFYGYYWLNNILDKTTFSKVIIKKYIVWQ